MPRLMQDDDTMVTSSIGGMQRFQFSGKRTEHLGATEYTLATVAVDVTGSVQPFAAELRKALITATDACRKSPRANNLLSRVVLFSTSLGNSGIEEIHGFKPLGEIDPAMYPQFSPAGMTNLYDAAFSAIGATNAYAKTLMDQDFLANGIVFVITDGDDNASSATVKMIAEEMARGANSEHIESLIGVLVGINCSTFRHKLEQLAKDAGMQFLDAGDATPQRLAKLASFVSQSVSSQSQSLGTGGPSQNIAATI